MHTILGLPKTKRLRRWEEKGGGHWGGGGTEYCNTVRKIGKYRNTVSKLTKYGYCSYETSRVDLRFEAKAGSSLEPEFRYLWKRDDVVITYNKKIQLHEGAKVLTIASITVDEAGNYTCVAYTPDPKRSEDQASATIDIRGTNTELE